MTKEDVLQTIKNILADGNYRTNADTVTMSTSLEELSFDSLDWVQILLDVESHYGLKEISDTEFSKCKTIEELVDLVTRTEKRDDTDGCGAQESPKPAETTEAPACP